MQYLIKDPNGHVVQQGNVVLNGKLLHWASLLCFPSVAYPDLWSTRAKPLGRMILGKMRITQFKISFVTRLAAFLVLNKEFDCNQLMISPTHGSFYHYAALNNSKNCYHFKVGTKLTKNNLRKAKRLGAYNGCRTNTFYFAWFNMTNGIVELIDPPNETESGLDINELINEQYQRIKERFSALECHPIQHKNRTYRVVNLSDGIVCGIDDEIFNAREVTHELLSSMDKVDEGDLLISLGIYVSVPNSENILNDD